MTSSGKRTEQVDAAPIHFEAKLLRPVAETKRPTWTFLLLPEEASQQLPSRGLVSVEGRMNQTPFQAALQPDGQGGHWLKVEQQMRKAAGLEVGDDVSLEITPMLEEPEPTVPPALRKALASAPPKALQVWDDITPLARRDWIHWIESAKREETRNKRVETTCDMLAKGKRRPCCFDRSGMYSKSLSCPVADETATDIDTGSQSGE